MEQKNDAASVVDGEGNAGTSGGEAPYQAHEATEKDQDRPADEEEQAAVEEDVVAPPARRKSHRPSLEVVEVKVASFYDKAGFNQELQVGSFTWKLMLLCKEVRMCLRTTAVVLLYYHMLHGRGGYTFRRNG